MRKTTFDVFKELLPTLVLYLLVTGSFSILLNFMGLGSDVFLKNTDPAALTPSFALTGMGVFSAILQIIFYLVIGLWGFGIILAIYRSVRFDSDISFADSFFFFNQQAGKSIGTYILQIVFTVIGFILLIIPAIIFSLAMIPLGAVMGIEQLQGRFGSLRAIKESWRITKGYKGMIFGRVIIAAIIFCVVVGISTVFTLGLGGASPILLSITSILSTLISGLVMYVAVVDIIRELVERGAFSAIEKIEEDEIGEEL